MKKLFLVCLLSIGGCATLQQHSAAVGAIVSQATMRYIEQSPLAERAAVAHRVIEIAHQIEAVSSGAPVTIAQLASLAVSAIPSNLEPSDRALALSIVQIAAQELELKVGKNVLSADQVVTVTEVVEAVAAAASFYTSA